MNDRAAYTVADALDLPIADRSVQMIATSPPYWGLRSYDTGDMKHAELGAERLHDCLAWARGDEPCGECYVCNTRAWGREVWRVLRDDGVMFLNLADTYSTHAAGRCSNPMATSNLAGVRTQEVARATKEAQPYRNAALPEKNLMGIPWRVALALQADGWWLRSAITWCKTNPMPESVQGSHYSRHRVTIEEYENLSRLRETERRNQDRASHLPYLPPGEGANGQAPLSAEREGASNGKGKGTARGRKGEAPTIQPLQTGAVEQGQIRGNGKGEGYPEKGHSEIQEFRKGQGEGDRTLSSHERFTVADRADETGQFPLYRFGEGAGQEAAGLCQTQGCHSPRPASNGRGLVRDSGAAQASLLLLREKESADARPRNTHQQGGFAREGEYSASVPELQLEEEGQDNPNLLDCPGCPKCEKTGGYISRKTAGRPTKATEQIFLFAKSPFYFYDSDAVKTETGANARDWWEISTAPYAGAHFATWPPALVERMIKAGTSERGVCPECGKSWERVVERTPMEIRHSERPSAMGEYGRTQASGTMTKPPTAETRGWRPTCDHDAAPVPAIVLDPFAGSGTTLMVARQLGRIGLGFDLSEKYLRDNCRVRLGHDKLAAWGKGISGGGSFAGLPLFATMEAQP